MKQFIAVVCIAFMICGCGHQTNDRSDHDPDPLPSPEPTPNPGPGPQPNPGPAPNPEPTPIADKVLAQCISRYLALASESGKQNITLGAKINKDCKGSDEKLQTILEERKMI